MRKQIVAAMIAALVVVTSAGAVSYHIVKSDKILTKRLIVGSTDSDVGVNNSGGLLSLVPTTEVIAEGGTISADACGGIKNVSSAAAVTTGTTNTFTAPAASNKGCVMQLCNVNAADAITLDDNALFNASGVAGATPGNTVLGALDCVAVASTGAVWNQLGPASQN